MAKKKFPINRPNTSFAMKANLVQREPQFQKRWDAIKLYDRTRAAAAGKPPFVFHDGPPYANGDIHLGHLLNKVLKDLVVRTKTMAGFDVNFVPGWDCHGLPIEHKVMKEQVAASGDADVMKIRYKCRDYAQKYVKLQAKQMQRLGTTGDYAHPYITMDPAYEAGVLEVFAELVAKGLVYRDLKPVHWSIANQTALADAELEYYDREDTSVYVLFEVVNPEVLSSASPPKTVPTDAPIYLLIWTTTPWTLPANMAVAVAEGTLYQLHFYESQGRSGYVIVEVESARRLQAQGMADLGEHLAVWDGGKLQEVELRYRHPFINRTSPVVVADYVTTEDGSGLVHTAPGHGVEDYGTGKYHQLKFRQESDGSCYVRHGLTEQHELGDDYPGADIYCPVRSDGTFDDTAPEWLRGVDVWKANDLVVAKLRETGHLFAAHQFTHSYPHDWRSKTPVIFRATEQWFVAMDRTIGLHMYVRDESLRPQLSPNEGESLRKRSLDTLVNIGFIPQWGINRMRGMLESRPDWCISRQRAWGLPIPVFYFADGSPLYTKQVAKCVADKIKGSPDGSNYWYKASAEELLEGYDPSQDAQSPHSMTKASIPHLTKGSDILDVWFESGSSWKAVLGRKDKPIGYPAALYLEGSDQHRGWFQVSLLTALAVTGDPPFDKLLTHGFMVDKDGKKLSKSGGNAISVDELMKHHGADVCRWWVASINFEHDIKADMAFFRLAGEQYRKVRNTIRFLLGNLADFDPAKDRRELLPADDAHSIDAWAWFKTTAMVQVVRQAYDEYDYRRASEAIFNHCNETLSAVYLAAVKDRLYCDKPESDRRRRTQTVMFDIANVLIRLVAPILVHTADEAWLALHGLDASSEECVHLKAFPEIAVWNDAPQDAWNDAMAMRDHVMKKIEDARAQRRIDNPLDMGVTVMLSPEAYGKVSPFEAEMADLCGVSRFEFVENGNETIDVEDLTHEPRCDRSWKRDGTVSPYTDAEGDTVMLSKRDAEALALA